jgi:hypothetical protein
MAGTPKMQEHFPAGAWQPTIPKNERYAENAECIFRRVRGSPRSRKTKGTPEMQEHFPAGAWQPTIPKNERYAENAGCIFRRVHGSPLSRKTKGTPKMQDAFFGGCVEVHYPEKRKVRRKCRSILRRVPMAQHAKANSAKSRRRVTYFTRQIPAATSVATKRLLFAPPRRSRISRAFTCREIRRQHLDATEFGSRVGM